MSRFCIVDHSYFPSDPRVRSQARALAEAGNEIDVVCLRQPGEPATGELGPRIRVFRLPVARDRSRRKLGYFAEYLRFLLLAAAKIAMLDRKRRYDGIQVCNPPEELVFAALAPKLRGVPVLLDIHDCLPPLFSDKYGLARDSLSYRILVRLELACCGFADRMIVASDPFKDRFVSLGIPPDKISVVMNAPEPQSGTDGGIPFIVTYAGSVFHRYGLETVVEGIARARARIDGLELHIYGSDVDEDYRAGLVKLAQERGVSDIIAFNERVAPLALRTILASSDLGLCPLRRSSHIDLTYSTKVLHYLQLGLPVLAAHTPAQERAFPSQALTFYRHDDPDDLAEKLIALAASIPRRRQAPRDDLLPANLSWGAMQERLLQVYDALVASSAVPRDVLTRAGGDSVVVTELAKGSPPVSRRSSEAMHHG